MFTAVHGSGVFLCFSKIIRTTFFSFLAGRKEDEINEKWMEKERERANKEREKEERGKKTLLFFSLLTPLNHVR